MLLDNVKVNELSYNFITEKPAEVLKVTIINKLNAPFFIINNILNECFNVENNNSIKLSLNIFLLGEEICGIFPKDIALKSVELAKEYISTTNYHLGFKLENA